MTNEVKPYLFLNYPLHIFEPEEDIRVEYDEINESLILIRRGKIEIVPIFDPISTNNSIRYRTPDSETTETDGVESKKPHPLPISCKLNGLNKRLIGILMTPHTLLILRDKKTICMLRYPIKKKVKKVIDFFWITKEHVVVVTSRTVEVYALGKKFRELKTFSFRHNISFCRFHPRCKIFVVTFEDRKACHVIQPFKIGEKALIKLNKLTLPEKRYVAFKKNEIELAWLYNITFLVILQSERQEADLYRLKKDQFDLMRKYNLFSPGQFHVSVVDSILIFHNCFNKYSLAFDVFAEQSIPVAPPMSIAQYHSFLKSTKIKSKEKEEQEEEEEEEQIIKKNEEIPPPKEKNIEEEEEEEEEKENKEQEKNIEDQEEEEEEDIQKDEIKKKQEEEEGEKIDENEEKKKEDVEEEEEEGETNPTVPPRTKKIRSTSVIVKVEPTQEITLYDPTWRYFTPNLILCTTSGTFHELHLSLLHIPLTIKNREERIKFLFRRVNSKFLLKNALRDLLLVVHHSFHELTTIFKIVNRFYYQAIVSGRIKNISLIQMTRTPDGSNNNNDSSSSSSSKRSSLLMNQSSPNRKHMGGQQGVGGGHREFGVKESDDQLGDPSLYLKSSSSHLHYPNSGETEGTRIVTQLGLPVIEQEDMLNLVFIPLLEETKKIEQQQQQEDQEDQEDQEEEEEEEQVVEKKEKEENSSKLNLDKMCLIVLEYLRSLINHRIPIQPKMQNFFVDILIDLGRFESLRQYISFKLIRESKAVAMKLIRLVSDEYPQAFDLALQMLVKEKEYGRISQIFLERGEILKVMHLIERYGLWEKVVFQKIEEEEAIIKKKKKKKNDNQEKKKDDQEKQEQEQDDDNEKEKEKEIYEIVDSVPMPAYVLQVAKESDEKKMVLFYHAYQKIRKLFRKRKIKFPYDDQTTDYENLYHIVFGGSKDDLEDDLDSDEDV